MLAVTLALSLSSRMVPEQARAEPSPPPPPPATAKTPEELQHAVNELLPELDAPTRARREQALHRLRELGPRILALLPAPELLPSAASAESVRQLRGELERQQARASIQGSKVTLQGTRPFGDWIREVSRQTRNPLDVSELPAAMAGRSVRLSLEGVDFWTAMDRVSQNAGLTMTLTPGIRGLKVQAAEKQPDSTPIDQVVAISGAFRVSAQPARIREIFGAADRRLLRVPLKIQPEPRLRPLFLHYSAAEVTAQTPDAAELPAMSPEAKYEVPLAEGGLEVSLPLDFVTPIAAPQAVSLRGKIWFTTAANQEPIRFNGLRSLRPARGREIARRRGGVTVALRQVVGPTATEERELRIEVAVTYDTGGPAFESHRNWMMHNAVYLEAPDGTRFPLNGGTETRLQGDGSIGIEYRFVRLPDPLPDYAFVYVAPTLIIDAPVEFRLDSVPVRKP